MARFSRLWMPGSVQHLIARFTDRSYRISGDAEREEYLRRLGLAVARTDWTVLAYALMSNHVHLCAVAGQSPASELMQPLQGGFARWLNRRQRRLGPVFAGRFSALACAPPHVARLLAYVHNNPVRAGLVPDAGLSLWTSHRAYVGRRVAPPWLDVQRGLALCGVSAGEFDELVRGFRGEPRDEDLSRGAVRRDRARVRAACGGPVEVSDACRSDGRVWREVRMSPGTPLRPRWTGSVSQVLACVILETGVTLERLRSREKSRVVCGARRLALLIWGRLGRRRIEMSTVLGLDAGCASRLVRRDLGAAALLAEQSDRIADLCWSTCGATECGATE